MNCRFHLSSFLLVLLLAMSCVATRRTPVIPIQSMRTDTLQLHTLHYDSVFIRQERYQDRSRDTVYLHDRSVEYQRNVTPRKEVEFLCPFMCKPQSIY